MLTRTFQHISGVGPRRELAVWQAGVNTWQDFLAHGKSALPANVYNLGRPVIERSIKALGSPGGLAWLAAQMPSKEHWRFYPHLQRVVYLDIETGGDPDDWGGVTVVGLYDGEKVEQYVTGHNIWLLNDAMKPYDVVVTFSGSSFDLPVLRRVFANLILPPVHIDLRWALRWLGLTGGLKRIERRLGLERPDLVSGLGGQDAVLLWADYQAGDQKALEALLTYNACDIINLKPLLEYACSNLTERLLGRI